MRISAIVAALKTNGPALALDSIKVFEKGLMNNIQGSSDYRVNLIKVQIDYALQQRAP